MPGDEIAVAAINAMSQRMSELQTALTSQTCEVNKQVADLKQHAEDQVEIFEKAVEKLKIHESDYEWRLDVLYKKSIKGQTEIKESFDKQFSSFRKKCDETHKDDNIKVAVNTKWGSISNETVRLLCATLIFISIWMEPNTLRTIIYKLMEIKIK